MKLASFALVGCAAFQSKQVDPVPVRVGIYALAREDQKATLRAAFAQSGYETEFIVLDAPDGTIDAEDDKAFHLLQERNIDVAMSMHGGADNGWTGEGYSVSLPSTFYHNMAFTHRNMPGAGVSLSSPSDLAGSTVLAWDTAIEDIGGTFKELAESGEMDFVPIHNEGIVTAFDQYPEGILIYDHGFVMEAYKKAGLHGPSLVRGHNIFPDMFVFPSACLEGIICDALNAGLHKICENGENSAILETYNLIPESGKFTTLCDHL